MKIPDFLASGEPARLIPVASDGSKEARAVSILLASLMSVPAFARVMMSSIGQRVGSRANLDCYTEVVFKGTDGTKLRPDGLIELDAGRGRVWRCLVEGKIGKADIDDVQVASYLGLAKTHKVDAVLTLSNQFATIPTHGPVRIPKTAQKGIDLFHWSWMYILTQARLLLSDDEFDRPEQRFILAEMARYFSHPSVGVSTFDRMNAEWKDLVNKVQAGVNVNRTSPEVERSVAAWHQESRDLCLALTRKVGRPVHIRLSRVHNDDPAQRLRDDSLALAETYGLHCGLDVPNAASPIEIHADVQRRCISVSMSMAAPKDKQRTTSRLNWLIRQLSKTKAEGIYIRAIWPGRAPATQATLAILRENPAAIEGENPKLLPTQLTVLLVRDLAGKFSGAKTFIEQLESAVPYFYEQVGQHLRPYVAPPPRLDSSNKASDGDEPLGDIAKEAAAASSEAVDDTSQQYSPEYKLPFVASHSPERDSRGNPEESNS